MSQSFRLKSDELRQNNPAKDVRQVDDAFYKVYPDNGNIRQFMLTWPDGVSTTIPYFAVSKTDYGQDGSITLHTSVGTIVFQGLRLRALYNDFFYSLPLEIIICDERYNDLNDETIFTVNKINML